MTEGFDEIWENNRGIKDVETIDKMLKEALEKGKQIKERELLENDELKDLVGIWKKLNNQEIGLLLHHFKRMEASVFFARENGEKIMIEKVLKLPRCPDCTREIGCIQSGSIEELKEEFRTQRSKGEMPNKEEEIKQEGFTENQRETLTQIKELILKFKCNDGNVLDCNENKCPFKIKGISSIHKWSEGCLHKRLFRLLEGKEKNDRVM